MLVPLAAGRGHLLGLCPNRSAKWNPGSILRLQCTQQLWLWAVSAWAGQPKIFGTLASWGGRGVTTGYLLV
jgi:hypothetical protein